LGSIDIGRISSLLEAGEAFNIAGLTVRNPYPDVDLIAQVIAPPVAVLADRAPVEMAEAERVGGFIPPACFEAWPDAAPPFLSLVGGEWRCAALAPLADDTERVPASVVVTLGGATLPNGALSLRGRANAAPQSLVVALAPADASPLTRALATASEPEPLLGGAQFARVAQGPGRVATRPPGCAALRVDCVRWSPLTRGEQLTRVATTLQTGPWRLRARFGREVTLDQPLTAPTDREVRP
jgi:hypothetical protein